MFKVGDKVRRKPEHRHEIGWDYGDCTLTVAEIDTRTNSLYFHEIQSVYGINKFDLVEPVNPPKNRCVEAMVAGKVGPHKVRVWVSVDPATPLTEVHGKQVETVLDEVRYVCGSQADLGFSPRYLAQSGA